MQFIPKRLKLFLLDKFGGLQILWYKKKPVKIIKNDYLLVLEAMAFAGIPIQKWMRGNIRLVKEKIFVLESSTVNHTSHQKQSSW